MSGDWQEPNCQILSGAVVDRIAASCSMVKYAEQNNRASDCHHADEKWLQAEHVPSNISLWTFSEVAGESKTDS
jgi:hypothetical protein